MIFREETHFYKTVDDIKKGMIDNNTSGSPLTYNSGSTPNNNEFTVNNGVIHVKDDSSSRNGALYHTILNGALGNIIEIELEVMSISGVQPKITVDFVSTTVGTETTIQSKGESNVWSKLRLKHVIERTADKHVIAIGTYTLDIAEFKMRNISVKLKTKNNEEIINAKLTPIRSDDTILMGNESHYYKKDGWVHLQIASSRKDSNNFSRYDNITILPEEFRPEKSFYFIGLCNNGSAGEVPFEPVPILVYNTGHIQVAQDATMEYIKGHTVFYVGGGTV